MSADYEVTVIGGGPCGLLTALLLARHGVRCALYERNPKLRDHPKAMGISRRTAEILQQIGLRQTLHTEDLAAPEYSLAIWSESLVGEEWGRVPLQSDDRDIAPYPAFHCPQPILERALLEALEREDSASIFFDHEVTAIRDEGDRVQLSLSRSGQSMETSARYVVAADGAGSPVRHWLGIDAVGPGDLGHFINTYFRADYAPHLAGRRAILHNLLRRPDLFEIMVAVNGRDLWLMHHFLQPGESVSDYSSDRLAEVIRDASGLPNVPVEVLGITQWVMSPKVASQFRRGNVFLTGDASARLSPAGGLGMNTGLQSAHNLAWKLVARLRGAADSLLDTYDSERRSHVMRTFELSGDFGVEVWQIIEAGFSGNFDRVRDLVAHSHRGESNLGIDLGWRYESGAFVPDSAAESTGDRFAAEPGRRAPHVWLEIDGAERSILDLYGAGFVLVAAGDATPWRSTVTPTGQIGGFELEIYQIGGAGGFGDVQGRFLEQYGIQPGGAVLVRPDGVVAWRSVTGNPSGLHAALESILRGS